MTTIIKRKPAYYLKYYDLYLERMLLSVFPGHKPDFMIIGAQKAATTSLYNYLNQVPTFRGSSNKEVYYFDQYYNFGKGTDWYHNFFKSRPLSGTKHYFEATPNYLYYPWCAERIHQYNPGLKLIAILREPVSRAYSAWNMYKGFFEKNEQSRFSTGLRPGEVNHIFEYYYKNRTEVPSFEECVAFEMQRMQEQPDIYEPSLIRRGLYYDQLLPYYQLFNKSQIHVVGFKELSNQPLRVVSDIYTFITGKSDYQPDIVVTERNKRKYNNPISEATRSELSDYYRPHNEKLFDLLGRELAW